MRARMTTGRYALLCALILGVGITRADDVLMEWTFDRDGDSEGWGNANHLADISVQDGALQGRIMDWDPFITSPQFEIPATAWQAVDVRLRTDCGGHGDIFWTNTTESRYGGFSPGKQTAFNVVGDNEWHEYRILPFWQNEERIILLRLDLPRPATPENGRRSFQVDFIRIVSLEQPGAELGKAAWDFTAGKHGWEALPGADMTAGPEGVTLHGNAEQLAGMRSPALRFSTYEKGYWLVLEMRAGAGRRGTLRWASDSHNGLATRRFDITADGRPHLYDIDMAASKGWDGDVFYLELEPSDAPGSRTQVSRITVSQDPLGPAQVAVTSAGLENALNRVGLRLPFTIALNNTGGAAVDDLRITSFELPDGVQVVGPDSWRTLPVLDPFDPIQITLQLRATKPVQGPYTLVLEGAGTEQARFSGTLAISASLDLPRADYVPEPEPVESDYEIGALYFPGWPTIDRWARIWPTAPERKPVLGWYDEGNPECVDWQIKWAVENGLSYFLVDWYWSAGSQHLDHWVKAFKEAKYRRYLKWAMMWANHNRPGSHSEEDQRAVTRFWIENYFNMPEYYRIEDMPVVMIWSPSGMERDMKDKGGVKRLLDISRDMAREAGYKGIWFVAMKWPEASTDPKDIQWLKDAGFDMTSLYHYMHHGGNAENPRHFPFDLVAESSYPWWKARLEADILPFIPNLSTGWDARPWHGSRATVIYGRTVPLFERICRDAKRFADETGIRRLVLAPLNEWGEGSYAEPNREFGFGMYEAVRNTFCRKPAGGWPQNYGPADVGLGPYDLPMPDRTQRSEWTFSDGTQGWNRMMGISDFKAADGMLTFKTNSNDPAIHIQLERTRAREYTRAVVRMKIAGNLENPGSLQLFWATPSGGATEATSVRAPLILDEAFHNYELPLGENPRWRGRISSLRLDPCSARDVTVTIDSIRLE